MWSASAERMAYDPWGKRRHANGRADTADSLVGRHTNRGYTLHEHLEEVGVIHMNGRVYDPLIGRFMSADPFIQSPDNLQSHNRYAYVLNNPLGYTDPSGYFSMKKLFRAVVVIAVAYYTGQWVGDAVMRSLAPTSDKAAAIGAIAGGAAGGAAAGFTGAALNGANLNPSLQAGLQGALTGALFVAAAGVGEATSMARYVAHAGAGCISSVAGGGQCGEGSASAVFGKFTTNAIAGVGGKGAQGMIVRGIATSVAGGVDRWGQVCQRRGNGGVWISGSALKVRSPNRQRFVLLTYWLLAMRSCVSSIDVWG